MRLFDFKSGKARVLLQEAKHPVYSCSRTSNRAVDAFSRKQQCAAHLGSQQTVQQGLPVGFKFGKSCKAVKRSDHHAGKCLSHTVASLLPGT